MIFMRLQYEGNPVSGQATEGIVLPSPYLNVDVQV